MKHISIIGRRWFQKKYGNTYHSVSVVVDGKVIGRADLAYGYGDMYIQTAFDLLRKAGYYRGKTYDDFFQDRMNHRERFTITVSDVARQRDL